MSNSEKPNLSSISTNTGTASLNKAVSQIIQDELPKSIQNLSQRYDAYMNIADYLEKEFISAQRSNSNENSEAIIADAKKYTFDSLEQLSHSLINSMKVFDHCLIAQEASVNSLSSQIETAASRISVIKQQHLLQGLKEVKKGNESQRSTTASQLINNTKNISPSETLNISKSVEDIEEEDILLPPHLR